MEDEVRSRIAFNGHTHAPGVMTESGLFKLPQDGDNEYELDDEKVIVKARVNGGRPQDFVLDTGSELTTISRQTASNLTTTPASTPLVTPTPSGR